MSCCKNYLLSSWNNRLASLTRIIDKWSALGWWVTASWHDRPLLFGCLPLVLVRWAMVSGFLCGVWNNITLLLFLLACCALLAVLCCCFHCDCSVPCSELSLSTSICHLPLATFAITAGAPKFFTPTTPHSPPVLLLASTAHAGHPPCQVGDAHFLLWNHVVCFTFTKSSKPNI